MNGQRKYIVVQIDNLAIDLANYNLDLIDMVSETLNTTFGINSREFMNSLLNYLKLSTKPTENVITATYNVLMESFSKRLEFPNTKAKNHFCNSIKTKFNTQKKSILKTLPNAISTLEVLKEKGFKLIGITDLPISVARNDIKLIGIDKYFDTVYAYDDSIKTPKSSTRLHDIWLATTVNFSLTTSCDVVEIPKNIYKPSKRIIEKVLDDFGLVPQEVIMIGRNIEQDLLPAKLIGIKTIFVDTKISIRNKHNLRLLLQHLGTRRVRELLNLHNNKRIQNELKPEAKVKSLQSLMYSLT